MFNISYQHLLIIFGDKKILIYEVCSHKAKLISIIKLDESLAHEKFNHILSCYPKAKFIIIFYSDNDEIEFISYPDIGALNVLKKIKKRIGQKIINSTIKDAILIHKPNDNNDNWKYCMLEYSTSNLVQSFVNIALQKNHFIKGIYFYNFEILKASKYLLKLIKSGNDQINIFYFQSSLEFIKKIIFLDDELLQIKHYQFDQGFDLETFILKENMLNKKYQDKASNINSFLVSPNNKIYTIAKNNVGKILINITQRNTISKHVNNSFFDEILYQFIIDQKSSPLKLHDIKTLNITEFVRRYVYWPLTIFVLISSIILGKLLYQRIMLKKELDFFKSQFSEIEFITKALAFEISERELLIDNNTYLKELNLSAGSQEYPMEVLNILHSIKSDNAFLDSLEYHEKDHNTLLLNIIFDSTDNADAISHTQSLIMHLKQHLPKKEITFYRSNEKIPNEKSLKIVIKITDK